jgi:hypothetical protein
MARCKPGCGGFWRRRLRLTGSWTRRTCSPEAAVSQQPPGRGPPRPLPQAILESSLSVATPRLSAGGDMKTSLAYIAGFFDGEGSIGVYSGGGSGMTLRAQVTQADALGSRDLLDEFRTEWGGSICIFNRTLRRQAWNFQVGGERASRLLRDLRPHLRLKADQADLALHWFHTRPVLGRDPLSGRVLPRSSESRAIAEEVASTLRQMKSDAVTATELGMLHARLRQIVNVKDD